MGPRLMATEPTCTCPPGQRRSLDDRHRPPCPLAKPGAVDTPEKAAAYAGSLDADLVKITRAVRELPDYIDHLPTEGQVEVLLRLKNLRNRLAEFLAAQ